MWIRYLLYVMNAEAKLTIMHKPSPKPARCVAQIQEREFGNGFSGERGGGSNDILSTLQFKMKTGYLPTLVKDMKSCKFCSL